MYEMFRFNPNNLETINAITAKHYNVMNYSLKIQYLITKYFEIGKVQYVLLVYNQKFHFSVI